MKKEEKTVEVKFTCTEEEFKIIKKHAKNCGIPIESFIMASIYRFDAFIRGEKV